MSILAPADAAAQLTKYIVRTQDIVADEMQHRIHPVISSRHRFQLPIGDQAGLTKTGVHLCRLPPNTISTTLHWHSHEDEWYYVVEAAENAAMLVQDEEDKTLETKEVKVVKGDFIAFPAGVKLAHGLSSGDGDLIYLLGGSREPLDISHYPEAGRRRVIANNLSIWAVEEDHVITNNC